MPKVDATRNYYDDLGVTPSSSADDIKKQYRKLAMQWHPDRNRGREEEASKKFQVIQAAFEILTDPTLKRQYNEARNKASSRFPTSSGVRGNPWANAGSDFPPPPRRAGANAGAGSSSGARTAPRPTPGAARYSNWGTGTTPRQNKTSQKEDPASAKAHYDAWNNMRANTGANTQRKPPPTPGRPPTSSARESKTSDSEGIPRTASQKQKAQASFGNSTRRTGFTPRSPGLGDEPPVTNNNYFTTRTRPNIFPDDAASTARQNRRTSAVPDPLAQFRDSFEGDRHSSPYATPGGEKTSLFGDGLNRARSTRETDRNSRKEDGDTSFPFPRQRSNSTPRSSSNDGGSEDSTRANTGAKGNGANPSTARGPSPRFSDRYRPKSVETDRAASETAGQTQGDAFANSSTANGATTQSPGGSTNFGFTGAPSTPGKRFVSSSAENISTKFVDEQPESWAFTAGGPPTEDTPLTSKLHRTQSGSRLGRRSPTRIHRRPVPPVPAADSVPRTNEEPNTNPASGFSAEEWGAKIGSVHFVPQPDTSSSASPTRRSSSRKNSKPVKVTRGGSAGIVDEDDEIPTTAAASWQNSPKPHPSAQSPMAMDIDTPPVDKDPELPKRSQPSDARTIPVEPTRPEWRAGDVNGNAPVLPQRPALTTDAAVNTATQSTSAPSTASTYVPQNGGSEDSEEFRASFADFKKVEPFIDPQPTGLQSFADLKTTLPFESRASSHVSVDKAQPVPHLDFPMAPVAPRLHPTLAVPGLRPSNSQWRKYAQDFYNYMEKWEAFNEKVLTHFATRQTEMVKRRQQFGRAWLESAQGVDGATLYQAELEQDHDVREQWMRACDEHQQRVREFVSFRDRAK